MLLKRIEMHNFRQFQGEQSLNFAVEPDKNITIVMGENGAGKTTLAQAFLWALYGETDFRVKELINRNIRDKMQPNDIEEVRVVLFINHDNVDYAISRRQKFKRDYSVVKEQNVDFSVACKKNGQQEFLKEFEARKLIKNMLPFELSKFFFFDGERIKAMSDEIEKGRSQQFAEAVKGLVGLTALMNAINHLKPSTTKNTVIGRYNNKIDDMGNAKLQEYSQKIRNLELANEEIESRLKEIEPQITYYQEEIGGLKSAILEFSDDIERKKKYGLLDELIKKQEMIKRDAVKALLNYFNKQAHSFFVKPLIEKSLRELSKAEKLDKGIPDMHQKTIEFLLNRGFCACGTKLSPGSEAAKELYKLMDFLPPKAIGTMLNQFAQSSREKNKQAEAFFASISALFTQIRELDNMITEKSDERTTLYNLLTDTTKVKAMTDKKSEYEKRVYQLSQEVKEKTQRLGAVKREREYTEANRNKLVLIDEKNKENEVYRQYAIHLHKEISEAYEYQELVTRQKLEAYINEIFTDIYEGGIKIEVDERYKIKVNVSDVLASEDALEQSTAQSYSVIFAFIAGIIKMAKEKSQQLLEHGQSKSEEENVFAEAAGYPLVMDAPLSAFDKKRIANICSTLPQIAQQIVFFIKDTDGDVAESHLGGRIGEKYLVRKNSLTSSEICAR